MASLHVNFDILSEILSRTDLKTMRKCRILSKECNALSYQSGFMQSHRERTKMMCGYLMRNSISSQSSLTYLAVNNSGVGELKLNFDFLPVSNVRILATDDIGLAFCTSQHPENQHYICKPTTREWELLPSSNPRYFGPNIGMIVLGSNPLWFKIVRISSNVMFCDYIDKSFLCEVFDSSVWAWKETCLMLSYYENFESEGISASGGLHWITSEREYKYKVLSFHPYKESWESISVPDSCNRGIRLGVCEGKLAILSSNIELVEVWIMNKCCEGKKRWIMKKCCCEEKKRWYKKYSIDLEGLEKEIGGSWPVSFFNADTLLMLNKFRATFYNIKNHQHHQLRLKGEIPTISFVQTDYESIQLKQKRRKWFWFSNLLDVKPVTYILYGIFVVYFSCN